jgi:ech hydrogenase subunit A
MGVKQRVEMRNWYMEDFFGSSKLTFISDALCTGILVVGVILLIGGVA